MHTQQIIHVKCELEEPVYNAPQAPSSGIKPPAKELTVLFLKVCPKHIQIKYTGASSLNLLDGLRVYKYR